MFINLKKIDDRIITFEFPEFNISEQVNTYYYFLDSDIKNKINEHTKIITVIQKLFNNWLKCLESCEENNYLPFDFEDEYISFFKIFKENYGIYKFQIICSRNFNGYSVIPSKVTFKSEDFKNCNIDFLTSEFIINKKDFILDIKTIIEDFQNKNKKSNKIIW
jgi:hypothetical protein